MKLGRIWKDGPDGPVARMVAVHPDEQRVVDLATAQAARLRRDGASDAGARRLAGALFPSSMSDAIALGRAFVEAAAAADREAPDDASLSVDDVRWARPARPAGHPRLADLPAAHEAVRRTARAGPPNPQFFKTPGLLQGLDRRRLRPRRAEIPYPVLAEQIDYELESGSSSGRPGRNLTPEQAEHALFGLTIFNDFSAATSRAGRWGCGMGPQKSKDFAYGIGPWITTIDEFPAAPEALSFSCVRQR